MEVEHECVGGQTALILATEHGSAECVRALLDAGANRSHITGVSFLLLVFFCSSSSVSICSCGDHNERLFKQYHMKGSVFVLNISTAVIWS